MAIIAFKKEMHSDQYGESYEYGVIDTEHTFRNEGRDFLATVITIEVDKDCFRLSQDKDFIDVSEIDNIEHITCHEYRRIETLLRLGIEFLRTVTN